MAKQTIDLGAAPNDRTGDTLRVAFDKINDNFTEVYEDIDDLAGDVSNATDSLISGEQILTLMSTGLVTPPSVEEVGNQTEVQGIVLTHGTPQRVFGTANATSESKEAPILGVIGGAGYGSGGGSDVRLYGGDGGLRSEEFGNTPLAISITTASQTSCVISNEDYTNNIDFITTGMTITVGESSSIIIGISEGEGVLLTVADEIFTEGTFDASISDQSGGDSRGWGGYVRIYAGDGRGGGYIRLYGGDSNTVVGDDDQEATAGYVRLRGGYSNRGQAGNIELEAGTSSADDQSLNGHIQMSTSRGTVIFGGWPETGPTAPNHWHITKETPTAIDLFFGDDYNYFKLPTIGGAEIKSTNPDTDDEFVWGFSNAGVSTIPGAVISTPSTPPSGTQSVGTVTAISVTNSPRQTWSNGTGVAAGDLNFVVTISQDGQGTATVETINDGGTGHWVGETFGPVLGDALGGATPADDMYFQVTAIDPDVYSDLDLTKLIHVLDGGYYRLLDGTEGQIIHLVIAPNTNPNEYCLLVGNGRVGSNTYTDIWFAPFYNGDAGVVTMIFTNGAWAASYGAWD